MGIHLGVWVENRENQMRATNDHVIAGDCTIPLQRLKRTEAESAQGVDARA